MVRGLIAGIGGTIAVAAIAGLGCKSEDEGFGAPPPCAAGQSCKPTIVGGGSSGSGGSGAGGSGAGGGVSGSLAGNVGVIATETFDALTLFNGKATILGDKAGGGQVSADYTGSATGFDLEGLVDGARWLLVQDVTMGGAGIFSTYSPTIVPGTAVTLPVIDSQLMTKIASTLPITGINATAAQIILLVRHKGKPFGGVSIQGAGPGGSIAYDTGPGTFSGITTATGSAGVILSLNTPAGAQGKVTITLVDSMAITYPLGQIPVAAGAATFYPVSL